MIVNARQEIKNLQPIRGEICRLIEERRSELEDNVREVSRLSATLNNAVEHETGLRLAHSQDLPRPEFNSPELIRLEENSITLRDPQTLQMAQSAMILHYGHIPNGNQQLASRALGRAEALDISRRENTRRIESFTKNRNFFPVLFQAPDGMEKTATLHDLQPKTIAEKVFNYFSPGDRFEMGSVNEALDKHSAYLSAERDSLERFALTAKEIAKNYEQNLSAFDRQFAAATDGQKTQPGFTARELAQIENLAVQQSDPIVHAEFETILRSALTTCQVAGLTVFENASAWNQQQAPDLDPTQLKSGKDDYLNAARNAPNKVATNTQAEFGILNEATVAAETDTASEVLAALL